jgi:hypothetical protein
MKLKNLIAIFVFAFSTATFAGDTTGKINLLYIHAYNDTVLFTMNSAETKFAPCAVTGRYAISTSSQQGRNILSTILAAKLSGLSISVSGKNTCATHGDAEDINAIYIN